VSNNYEIRMERDGFWCRGMQFLVIVWRRARGTDVDGHCFGSQEDVALRVEANFLMLK